MSSRYTTSFFDHKKPWSRLKNEVLGKYLKPYLAKINKLGKKIVLLDCFAGPGRYKSGEVGSPLIMCTVVAENAEVRKKTKLIFVNIEAQHHRMLETEIKGLNMEDCAITVHAGSEFILNNLPKYLGDSVVFSYLDPFALKGCDLKTLLPLLSRPTIYSTELLIIVNMTEFHRRAARFATQMGAKIPKEIEAHHLFLDQVFGGDYWKKFEFDPTMPSKLRELKVIEGYCQKLQQHLPFTGFCPVRVAKDGPTKHFMVFCSRHPDALMLMNDIMRGAYERHIFKAGDVEPDLIEPVELESIILGLVKAKPGVTRGKLKIEVFRKYFMRFYEREINAAVKSLSSSKIQFKSTTSKLNEESKLNPI